MMLQMVSVYDEKAKAYMPVMCFNQIGQARRAFYDAVEDPQTGLSKHPEDYKLYRLGVLDDNTGEITTIIPPEVLASATDVRNQ